jgi:ATP-dependent exoDNAse (exonuclease V) beta subunit
LQNPELIQQLSEYGQNSLAKIIPILAESLQQRQRFSLRTWIEKTWWKLEGPKCLSDELDLDNAESFFIMLEQISVNTQTLDRNAIYQYLWRLKAQAKPQSKAMVQIMTIHKSKGLEFDTVFIPGLGKGEKADMPPLLMWESYPLPTGEHGLLMAPIKNKGLAQEPIYDFIKQTNQARKRFENQRLLYVAVTRAKKRLYLMGQCHFSEKQQAFVPRAGSFLALLWPLIRHELNDQSFVSLADGTKLTHNHRPSHAYLYRLNQHNVKLIKPVEPDVLLNESNQVQLEPNDFTARAVGILVHRYLAEIAIQGLDKWTLNKLETLQDKFRMELSFMGVPEIQINEAVDRVKSALGRILEDEKGQWILASRLGAKSEFAINCFSNGRCKKYIIDRTFIDESGTRWIIDYKTSCPAPGQDLDSFMQEQKAYYINQLETYANKFNDTKQQYLGLYFPLVPSFIQWKLKD